jgi:hypothetical protein
MAFPRHVYSLPQLPRSRQPYIPQISDVFPLQPQHHDRIPKKNPPLLAGPQGGVIISQNKKRNKDADAKSASSSNSSATETVFAVPLAPSPKAQCPIRPYLGILFEPPLEESKEGKDGDDDKETLANPPPYLDGRIKLWNTLTLCTFVIINLLLVFCTLLVSSLWSGIEFCENQAYLHGILIHQSSTAIILARTETAKPGEPSESHPA